MLFSKNFWLLSLFVALTCGCQNNKTPEKTIKTDLDNFQLHGKVKSMKLNSYAQKPTGNPEDSLAQVGVSYLVNFSADGLITSVTYFSVTGDIQYNEVYERDANYNIKEIRAEDISHKTLSKSLYKNDSLGRPVEITVYSMNGKVLRKFTHGYDKAGNLIEYKSYGGDSSLNSTVNYKYDSLNNRKYQIRTFASGEISNEVESKYDSMSFVIEDKITSPNLEGVIYTRYTYKFDSSGNWVEKSEEINSGDHKISGKFSKRIITYY